MAIEIAGVSSRVGSGTSTSHYVTLPAGVQDGDLGFVFIYERDFSRSVSSVTGWTFVASRGQDTTDSQYNRVHLYKKELTADLSSTNVTVNFDSSTSGLNVNMTAVVVRGANSTLAGSSTTGGNSATVSIPAITATVSNHYSLAFIGHQGDSDIAPPSGWTQVSQFDTGSQRLAVHGVQTSVAANTEAAATTAAGTVSNQYAVVRVAIETASAPVPVTVNAGSPMTASATTVNATVSIGDGYTAQPMTASATMPGGTGTGNIFKLTVTDDTYTQSNSPTVSDGSATSINIGKPYGGAGNTGLFKFSAMPNLAGSIVTSHTMSLFHPYSSAFSATLDVYTVTGAWDESVTHATLPTMTLHSSQAKDVVPGEAVVLNIAGADTGNGIAIKASTGKFVVYSTENASGSLHPFAMLTTGSSEGAEFSATPATASASIPEPTISTTNGASVGAQPMTASAGMPNVTISVISQITISASPLDATAEMSANSGFSVPKTVIANVMPGTAEAVNPVISTTKGVKYVAQVMAATAQWKQPELVNDVPIQSVEAEDPYFQRIMAQNPYGWLRLNDKGVTVIDRILGNRNAFYNSVLMGQNDGPNGRHSVHFDGDGYIDNSYERDIAQSAGDEGAPSGNYALEFSLRTTDKNSFIMLTQDYRSNAQPSDERLGEVFDIVLTNGRVSARRWGQGPSGFNVAPVTTMTGFKDIADGEWHSVVIRPSVESGEGHEIWIDGKLDVRRRGFTFAFGMPDFIGGRPGTINYFTDLGELPSSEFFVGDMSEIVVRRDVGREQIPRNYYAFMGWTPIEVDPVEAFAFTPDGAKGRGNQKRALLLYWGYDTEAYNVGGMNPHWDEGVNMEPLFVPDYFNPFVHEGYLVFPKAVLGDIRQNSNTPYYDEVTDYTRLISLKKDVDIDDYDVIFFENWPDEGHEIDEAEGVEKGGRERLVSELRWANNRGVGLFVSHPRLAVDLGIVDRVEWASPLYDRGDPNRLYDYGSAIKFPWNIAGNDGLTNYTYAPSAGQAMNTDPAYLANKATNYGDTNKNDRFRIRALIEGLTDIPGYMIKEAIYHKDSGEWGWSGAAYKYLKEPLKIGDEFIFHGTNMGFDYDAVRGFPGITNGVNLARWFGQWATPLENVKAGTVVTTYGEKHWSGTEQKNNPYRNWATTIVLRPGDNLAGKPVCGKIFVNFTERATAVPKTVRVQNLPESWEGSPGVKSTGDTIGIETPAQREWDYSWTRTSLRVSGQSSQTEQVLQLNPDGTTTVVNAPAVGAELVMTRSGQIFPTEYKPLMQMVTRGLIWLSEKVEIGNGSNTQIADTLDAQASMPNPMVIAERDNDVTVPPMNALAVMPKVAEDESGDADVFTLPATAIAEFTGYGKTISAGPMEAEAELVESFDMVHATGEQVVLTLHGTDVTLYLKEEV